MHMQFLPERDYVTFRSLLSQFRLSSVCNVGAPYSRGWSFRQHFFTAVYTDLRAKFYEDRPRGTRPPEALNARGVSK